MTLAGRSPGFCRTLGSPGARLSSPSATAKKDRPPSGVLRSSTYPMLRRPRRQLLALLSAFVLALTIAGGLSASSAGVQVACAATWNSSSVYTGENVVSYNGQNWAAQWWTQGETPGTTGVLSSGTGPRRRRYGTPA